MKDEKDIEKILSIPKTIHVAESDHREQLKSKLMSEMQKRNSLQDSPVNRKRSFVLIPSSLCFSAPSIFGVGSCCLHLIWFPRTVRPFWAAMFFRKGPTSTWSTRLVFSRRNMVSPLLLRLLRYRMLSGVIVLCLVCLYAC